MSKVWHFLKKELMLTVSLLAAIAGLIITPPRAAFFAAIDWRTLGILLMMLCVLEGFKQEKVLMPVENLAAKCKSPITLSLFLVFGVFFCSMFVTNDVSLIIFVPLTMALFRSAGQEQYILPVITLENIAAIRGSLLMPFGSPQNLFLFSKAQVGVGHFMWHMLPLAAMSAVLLVAFILILYRKQKHQRLCFAPAAGVWKKTRRAHRIMYTVLFMLVLGVIVSRTAYWPPALGVVLCTLLLGDRKIFLKVDYVLLITFLCFFIFSSAIAGNEGIAAFLKKAVAGREYWWAIGLSQIISNVPASIVLHPFTKNFAGLIYGADTAGLCSLIGSLASVINYRIYTREYPENGGKFVKTFTLISWAFFIIVVIPGYLLSKWDFFA